jgi:predicted dehydrogenase
MTRPRNWALIGVGGMGAAHLNALHTLESEGRVRLVSVADPFTDRLAETKTALEQRGVRWYPDYAEMFQKEADLEAVSICTPIPLHDRMARAALGRGLWVYLEKPPVPLIQQLEDLIALDARRRIAVGFQMINSDSVRQLKRWRLEGALGAVRSIRVCVAWPRLTHYYQRASWAGRLTLGDEPVFDGPATNANSHHVHTIMFLAGETMDAFAVPDTVEAELYRARPIQSYDVGCLRGTFDGGIEFSCAVAHATEQMVPYRIELIGTNGRAWIADNGKQTGNDRGLPNPPQPESNLFLESYRGFALYADGQRPRPYTYLADTRGYVLATNGALLSSDGIHDISSAHWRVYGQGDDSGYDVQGLVEWIAQTGQTGALFSEMGVPWAKQGRRVSLKELRTLDLNALPG